MITWVVSAIICLFILKQFWDRFKPISYKGKTVWVTGASSGIGECLAREFHSLGAFVILSGRNEDELRRVNKELGNSVVFRLDLADSSKVIPQALKLMEKFRVDILVNNAGISQRALFEQGLQGLEMERKLMEVNYFSVVAMTKAFVRGLNGRKGTVVVVSSTAGLLPSIGSSGYSACKCGIIGYFQAMSSELRDEGVQVVNLAPGYVDTNVTLNALDEKGNKSGVEDPRNKEGFHPQLFAKKAVRKIYNGEKEIIITQKLQYLPLFIKSIAPRLSTAIISMIMKNEVKRILKKGR